jgi:hypothetical protein
MRSLRGCTPLCFLVLACSAADPGVEGLTRGEFSKDGGPTQDVVMPPVDGATKDTGMPKQDAANDTGTTTTTAFTGAGAYASNQPATTAVQHHMANGVGITPGLGVDCLSCHKMGGAGVEFLFGGTVFLDKAGTMPAANK